MTRDRDIGTPLQNRPPPEQTPVLGVPASITLANTPIEDRLAQRHDGVWAELAPLRQGRSGVIRTDLKAEQVAAVLNEQLLHYSPADIGRIIESFPTKLHHHARAALSVASGFATIESLGDLGEALKGEVVFTPGPASLVSNLRYTANRKALFGDLALQHNDDIRKCTATVLDSALLHRLEREPGFAKEICARGIKLLNPRGFVDGINMFNSVTPEEIKDRLGTVIHAALEYQASVGKTLTFNNAVRLALDAPTLERLIKAGEQAGVGDKLLSLLRDVEGGTPRVRHKTDTSVTVALIPGEPESIALKFSREELRSILMSARGAVETTNDGPASEELLVDQTTNEALALRLNGVCGVTPEQLTTELSKLPEGYRPVAAELAIRNSIVYSHRTFAHELRQVHASLLERAEQMGVEPSAVKYAVPDSAKSYGIVTMAYCIANNIPLDQIIDTQDLKNLKALTKKDFIVILDDLAGSGDSLANEVAKLAPHTRVVAAPLIATSHSLQRFPNVPHTTIWGIGHSPLMAGLDPVSSRIVDLLIGSKGYGNAALCTTFTYMSPDNNSAFWSKHFAPYFTIGGRAIKGSHYEAPDLKTAQKIITPKFNDALEKVARIVDQAEVTLATGLELARDIEAICKVAASFEVTPDPQKVTALHRFHNELMTDTAGVVKRAADLITSEATPALNDVVGSLKSLQQARGYLVTRTEETPTRLILDRAIAIEPILTATGRTVFASELKALEGMATGDILDSRVAAEQCEKVGSLRKMAGLFYASGQAPALVHAEAAVMAGAAASITAGSREILLELARPSGNDMAVASRRSDVQLVFTALRTHLGPTFRSDTVAGLAAEDSVHLTGELDRLLSARATLADESRPLPRRLESARHLVAVSSLLETRTGLPQVAQMRESFRPLDRAIEELAVSGPRHDTASSLEHLSGLVWFRHELNGLGPAAEEALADTRLHLESALQQSRTEIQTSVAHTIGELRNGRPDPAAILPADGLYRTLVVAAGNETVSPEVRALATEGLTKIWSDWATQADRTLVAAWGGGPADITATRSLLREIVRSSALIGVAPDAAVLRLSSRAEVLESYLSQRENVRSTGGLDGFSRLLNLYLPRTMQALDDPRFPLERERKALLDECFKRIEPLLTLDTGPDAKPELLSIYSKLPELARMFDGEQRRQIEGLLRDQERFISLAGSVYEYKVAELIGAQLTTDEIRDHAAQFLALSALTEGRIDAAISIEQVAALNLFGNAVRRAVEKEPACLGPDEVAALQPLFQYEFGEGFNETMRACGFDRYGNYAPDGIVRGVVEASVDDAFINRFGYLVNDFKATRSLDPAELKKGVKALLGEVASHLARRTGPGTPPILSDFVLRTLASGGTGGLGKILDKYTGGGPATST